MANYTLGQAAAKLNRTAGRLAQMVRAGQIRARRIESTAIGAGFAYLISDRELRRLAEFFGASRRKDAGPRKPRRAKAKPAKA